MALLFKYPPPLLRIQNISRRRYLEWIERYSKNNKKSRNCWQDIAAIGKNNQKKIPNCSDLNADIQNVLRFRYSGGKKCSVIHAQLEICSVRNAQLFNYTDKNVQFLKNAQITMFSWKKCWYEMVRYAPRITALGVTLKHTLSKRLQVSSTKIPLNDPVIGPSISITFLRPKCSIYASISIFKSKI